MVLSDLSATFSYFSALQNPKMPEGPEIHMAARFINQVSSCHKFGGSVVKSDVSTKNPDVSFEAKMYRISAEARGKELKVYLEDAKSSKKKTHILFRFGMSGCFKFTEIENLPKHAHLRFFTTAEKVQKVLSFVDYRRFGRWEIEGDWGKDRGPDPIYDYENFRKNVLDNLSAAPFNKPICETMLDQKYFNGIGNYLRAEILYRLKIKPFTQSREVLEPLKDASVKTEGPDILQLCNLVPTEVLSLDKGKNYFHDPEFDESDKSFSSWLQCYYVEGMNNLQDGNGRTMWFEGDPGPMVPKNAKVVGRKGGTGSKVPQSGANVKVEVKENKKVVKGTKSKEEIKVEIKVEQDEHTYVKKRNVTRRSKKEDNIKIEIEDEKPLTNGVNSPKQSKRPRRARK